MGRIKPVFFYEFEFYVLSNFSPFQVEWDGNVYMTSEHAYQASKFENSEIKKKIKGARSAHDAMKLANIIYDDKTRSDWNDVRLSIMEGVVRAKLSQHYYVQKKLLATGDRELIENSPRDSFWGWGPKKTGENHLGKIWMKLREELKEGRIQRAEDTYE